MQVFLSYASEQRDVAEAISLALVSGGHRVFFDRKNLPPGQTYNNQISHAIAQSHAFICLVSKESFTSGRYTLTELEFAREKWV